MVGELIIKSFVLAGIIGFVGVAFFMLLNSRSSWIDRRSYDDDYDPERVMSPYRVKPIGRKRRLADSSDEVRMYIDKNKQDGEDETDNGDAEKDLQEPVAEESDTESLDPDNEIDPASQADSEPKEEGSQLNEAG